MNLLQSGRMQVGSWDPNHSYLGYAPPVLEDPNEDIMTNQKKTLSKLIEENMKLRDQYTKAKEIKQNEQDIIS